MEYKFLIEYVNGDNWKSPYFTSTVSVVAESYLEAKLMAEQLVYTPQPGKPEHIQITNTVLLWRSE